LFEAISVASLCRRSFARRSLLLALVLAAVTLGAPLAPARAADEAAARQVVDSFYQTLLATMKEGKALGFDGRFKRLAPAVQQAFDLPLMTRLSIGSAWSGLSPAQQQQLVDGFSQFSAASYASNFNDFGGEKFELTGTRPSQNGRVIVETRLTPAGDAPVALNYLLQPGNGQSWKIIDVYLTGTISQLATYQSEFRAVVQRDGADGLIALFAKKVDDLRRK